MGEHRVSARARRVILCSFLVALAQPVAHAAAASVPAPVAVRSTSTPTPIIKPGLNTEYLWLVPSRSHDARRIHLAMGIFVGYDLSAQSLPAEMDLLLRDPQSGKVRDFLLAFNTTLNGLPLKCDHGKVIANEHFCGALPGDIVPGKTMIALLYWRGGVPDFPLLLGTDTIVTLQP